MSDMITHDYDEFIIRNRVRVNKYLNIALWCFVLTGPAIAFGIKGGVFNDATYRTCFYISILVIALATIHLLLMKRRAKSYINGVFALTALDILLVYMSYSHVHIFLTWFLVPILSLLFCDKRVYFYGLITNYILMVATTWLIAPYEVALGGEYTEALPYFLNAIGGYTIETLVLFAASYFLGKLTMDYYRELFEQYSVIKENKNLVEEKMEILDSMAEIYDNVNLVNFVDNTEMSIRKSTQQKIGIDMTTQTHTAMNQRLKDRVAKEQLDDFMKFTNIKTVRARLSQKKLISADFMDVVDGWFRAQYITVDSTLDGIPNTVIYTTQNVDEEKRREEHLIRISLTDEMTRLYNRRCYDEDLNEIRRNGLGENLVLFSVDVNGLKKVNDTKGHAAGDELIKGAADCLAFVVGNKGKAYRTGGDEFIAIIRVDNPEAMRQEILEKTKEWKGLYNDKITMSVGYAAAKDYQDVSVEDLERYADEDMYKEKARYYQETGIDRRKS
ncbi:MAG: GGDEF domain-containing protein [Lachnospiraceae bacterium]|nr:GGDEF domain-containing protein [Lachnospiraceae bacterium]